MPRQPQKGMSANGRGTMALAGVTAGDGLRRYP